MNFKTNYIVRWLYSKAPLFFWDDYKTYKSITQLISEFEIYDYEQMKKWQFLKLKEIVNYSWDNIIGYREYWDSNGFNPEKLKTLKDIERIPIIDKHIIRNDLDNFTNKKLKKIKFTTTGGSTGNPFGFYRDKNSDMVEKAFVHDMWRRFDYKITLKTKSVILRGNNTKELYYNDPIVGLILSSYEINKTNVKLYLNLIEETKYTVLQAYPSALYSMALIMKEYNYSINHKFNTIMLGSEPLHDFQKDLISEIFNTKICHWYGQSEQVVLACNCPYNELFHIYPQYGVTEIVEGELVGTSFWNHATPFIRYRTNDYAETSVKKCENHLKYNLLKKLKGRKQDYIKNADGADVSLTGLIYGQHFRAFNNIIELQVEQLKKGEINIMILPTNNFTEEDVKEMEEKIKIASHGKVLARVVFVNKLLKSNSGKAVLLKD